MLLFPACGNGAYEFRSFLIHQDGEFFSALRFGNEPRKSKKIVLLSPRNRYNPKPGAIAI